jgi:nucleoside-diphosphate-sugar epimerase
MRVLVSGGNRYIGLELVHELAAAGHQVTAINSHEIPLPAGVQRIHADRRLPGAFRTALAPVSDQFDVFFDNTAFVPADVLPMVELFRGKLQHYVFTSSQAVYRRSFVLPIQEDFRRHSPDDDDHRKAYGVGKVRCEDLLLDAYRTSGFPATCLRVGHTLGPRSPAATRDPVFFARLEAGRPVLIPGEGFACTQLIHINDVARGMLSLIGKDAVKGQAYNLTGKEIASIVGVIHLIAAAMGVSAHIVNVPIERARQQRPPLLHWGEALVGSAILSTEKLTHDTGWTTRFGIEAGYRDSWQWYQREGRNWYTHDFSAEDQLLAELGQS